MTAVTAHIQVPRRTERTEQVGGGVSGKVGQGHRFEQMAAMGVEGKQGQEVRSILPRC